MADEPGPSSGSNDLRQAAARIARSKAKREHLALLLDRGRTMVHIDARRPGVQVPPQFADDNELRLNLSPRFPDVQMVLNERGVSATLSFQRTPFRVFLPWPCIWGIGPSDGSALPRIWAEDLPVEASAWLAAEEPGAKEAATSEAAEPTRWKPRLVTRDDLAPLEAVELPAEGEGTGKGEEAVPAREEKPADKPGPPASRPRLKLVE